MDETFSRRSFFPKHTYYFSSHGLFTARQKHHHVLQNKNLAYVSRYALGSRLPQTDPANPCLISC